MTILMMQRTYNDLQQYNGNEKIKIFDFLLKMLSQVAFSGQHGKG